MENTGYTHDYNADRLLPSDNVAQENLVIRRTTVSAAQEDTRVPRRAGTVAARLLRHGIHDQRGYPAALKSQ